MLEVAIPASDHRGEIGNNPRHAVASGATCLFAYLVLETLPFKLTIPNVSFVRAKGQAIGVEPRLDFVQRRLRVFRTLAQDHKIVRVAHHTIAQFGHSFVQGVQVNVRQ